MPWNGALGTSLFNQGVPVPIGDPSTSKVVHQKTPDLRSLLPLSQWLSILLIKWAIPLYSLIFSLRKLQYPQLTDQLKFTANVISCRKKCKKCNRLLLFYRSGYNAFWRPSFRRYYVMNEASPWYLLHFRNQTSSEGIGSRLVNGTTKGRVWNLQGFTLYGVL